MYRRSAGRPLIPIAMFMWPSRQARPNVSVITTGTSTPVVFLMPRRMRPAEPSGSTGRRMSVSGAPAFEWSTPAFAQTKPCLVSTMSTPRCHRTIRAVSSSTTCKLLGSLPDSAAMRSASGPGTTSASLRMRPSDFDTTFCARASTSPASNERPLARSTRMSIAARSSPGLISGRPSMGMSVTSDTASEFR